MTGERSGTFWGPDFDALQAQDPEIAGVVLGELDRLRNGLQPGATDTHLALLDLREAGVPGLTGAVAEARCDAARITLNKNAIPYDPERPMVASGIRVGTPAVTTQGMTEPAMKEVAALIGRAVRDADGSAATEVAEAVSALVADHPAYPTPA